MYHVCTLSVFSFFWGGVCMYIPSPESEGYCMRTVCGGGERGRGVFQC